MRAQLRDPDYDMMRPLPLAACLALATALPLAAINAQDVPAPADAPAASPAPAAPLAGDADNGKLLAYTCQGCHGVTGCGEISPNPLKNISQRLLARKTIRRLKLDSPEHNAMRARHYARYLRGKDAQTLKELSPFVWYEAQRQGLL